MGEREWETALHAKAGSKECIPTNACNARLPPSYHSKLPSSARLRTDAGTLNTHIHTHIGLHTQDDEPGTAGHATHLTCPLRPGPRSRCGTLCSRTGSGLQGCGGSPLPAALACRHQFTCTCSLGCPDARLASVLVRTLLAFICALLPVTIFRNRVNKQ